MLAACSASRRRWADERSSTSSAISCATRSANRPAILRPGAREQHPDRAPIGGLRGGAFHEAASLRAVDEAADAGLVEVQHAGEFDDARLAIAEYPQQPDLGQRQLVLGRHARERRPDQNESSMSASVEIRLLLMVCHPLILS